MALMQRPYGPSPANVSGQNVFAQNMQAALAQGVLPALQSIAVTTAVVLTNPLNTAQLLSVPLPPKIGLEQIPLDVNWSGYVKTTNAGNVTLALYSGTSATVGSDTALATTGAVAVTSTTCPFFLHIKGIYDSVSGKFQGYYDGQLNGTVIAPTTLTAIPTGISDAGGAGNAPVINFLAAITSSGAAGGTPTTINTQNFSAG
jgi:hypothetical protein